MTAERRAEVAFRIVGIALLALCLPAACLWSRMVWRMATSGASARDYPVPVLVVLAWSLGPLLLVVRAGGLSRLLLRSHERSYSDTAQQIVHIGICLVALVLPVQLLLGVIGNLLLGKWVVFAVLAVGCASIVLVLVCSWPVTRLLYSFVDSAAGRSQNTAAVAGGILLVGAFTLLAALARFSATLAGAWASGAGPRLRYQGASAACGVMLVLLAGRLALGMWRRWPVPDQTLQREEAPPRIWYEIALFLAAVHLLIPGITSLLWGSGQWVTLALVVSAVPLARYLVPWLASVLDGRGFTGPEENDSRGLLWLETGITVLALHVAIRNVALFVELAMSSRSSLPWGAIGARVVFNGAPAQHKALLALLVAVILIFLRGDVAWLLRCRIGARLQLKWQSRAAALCPWIFLLGVWHLAYFLPALASLLVADSDGRFGPSQLAPARMAGLMLAMVLFSFAGPLSRRLSHGPILPRIWQLGHEPRGVGEHAGTSDKDE